SDADGWAVSPEHILVDRSCHPQVSYFSSGEFCEPDVAVSAPDDTIWARSTGRERKFLDLASHRHLVNTITRVLCDIEPATAAFGDASRSSAVGERKLRQRSKRRQTANPISGMFGEPEVSVTSVDNSSRATFGCGQGNVRGRPV